MLMVGWPGERPPARSDDDPCRRPGRALPALPVPLRAVDPPSAPSGKDPSPLFAVSRDCSAPTIGVQSTRRGEAATASASPGPTPISSESSPHPLVKDSSLAVDPPTDETASDSESLGESTTASSASSYRPIIIPCWTAVALEVDGTCADAEAWAEPASALPAAAAAAPPAPPALPAPAPAAPDAAAVAASISPASAANRLAAHTALRSDLDLPAELEDVTATWVDWGD